MLKLEISTPPYCPCRLPQEAEIGWERAAYLALEAMDNDRRTRASRRSLTPSRR